MEIYKEELEDMEDLVKMIYEASMEKGVSPYIKAFALSDNQYLYYRMFVAMGYFEHSRGCPFFAYVVSDKKPENFLYWSTIKNRILITKAGKPLESNEVVVTIVNVKRPPEIIMPTIEEIRNDGR